MIQSGNLDGQLHVCDFVSSLHESQASSGIHETSLDAKYGNQQEKANPNG
jgi:hypothetical protein